MSADDKVAFAVTREFNGNKFTIKYNGTVKGDTITGKTEFDRNCASCHAADLNGIGRKYDSAMLREQLLRPKNLNGPQSFAVDVVTNAKAAAGRQHHNQLLENSTPAQVANLIAYLQTR